MNSLNEHPSARVPFELWRVIFNDVYTAKTCISHPPYYPYVISTLHARLNAYRCVARVCKIWHTFATDVFLEDLNLESADSLVGTRNLFASTNDNKGTKRGASVHKVSIGFPEFRNTISRPRRPLDPTDEALQAEREQHTRTREKGDDPGELKLDRQRIVRYGWKPSSTMQHSHWRQWHALCAGVLHMCTSLSVVHIDFSSSHSVRRMSRSGDNYRSLFPPPDLNNQGVLHGLLALQNLRDLSLVDPSPLEAYGPEFIKWERLHTLSITLNHSQAELAEMDFIPPRGLKSFTFRDKTSGRTNWPASSDLARCTDLQRLELGVYNLKNLTIRFAIAFLIRSYQHSLIELVLDHFDYNRHDETSFQDCVLAPQRAIPGSAIDTSSPLDFPKLEILRVRKAHCTSELFRSFIRRADHLREVDLGTLDYRADVTQKDQWLKALSAPSLNKLEVLRLGRMHDSEEPALRALSEEQGFELTIEEMRNG